MSLRSSPSSFSRAATSCRLLAKSRSARRSRYHAAAVHWGGANASTVFCVPSGFVVTVRLLTSFPVAAALIVAAFRATASASAFFVAMKNSE